MARWRYAGSVVRPCRLLVLLAGIGPLAPACRAPEELREPRRVQEHRVLQPLPPRRAAVACHDGSGALAELKLLPLAFAGYCLDANSSVRARDRQLALAAGGSDALQAACSKRLGPVCARYLQLGLERVVGLRYVQASGGEGALDVLLTRFSSAEGAFASYTESLVGERDPAQIRAEPMAGEANAVQIGTAALAWRARYVLRLSYNNASEDTEAAQGSARGLLAGLVGHVTRAAGSENRELAAVRQLPTRGRLPLGVRYDPGEVLGVSAVRGAAQGYYQDHDKRWRVLAVTRADADAAEDVLRAFRRHPQGQKLKWAPLNGMRFTQRRSSAEPNLDWVIGQRGSVVYAVGDEATALLPGVSAAEEARVKLSLFEKLERLAELGGS